ncbi:hypothetical protein LWI28_009874 [Acer negundo]|uniref:RNase H type-1 domain-containing protein n=1 Tax=Acer negundo TaxID=4023 RepID=A0AAD5JA20_ACENE|nr:hypothetical protein LWI28_009874 [Acer negundo]
MFKINTDVAVLIGSKKIGVGRVVRIVQVRVAFWFSAFFLVESDALNVVNLIRSGRPPDTDVGTVIGDILKVMASCSYPFILFVPRKVNLVARSLVKMAMSIDEDKFWLEYVPPYVEKLVLGDVPS